MQNDNFNELLIFSSFEPDKNVRIPLHQGIIFLFFILIHNEAQEARDVYKSPGPICTFSYGTSKDQKAWCRIFF